MNKYTIDNELRQVERLRELYPPGTKIQCIKMDDPYHAVPQVPSVQLIMLTMLVQFICPGRTDQVLG